MEHNKKKGMGSGTKLDTITTITLERLQKRGYQSMLYYYFKVNPQLNEPLYTYVAVVGEVHLIAYSRGGHLLD